MILAQLKTKRISAEQFFMLSVMIVNGGNYLYNLLLGRILGPVQFSDAAILITLLLVLSFVAMTFQLTVTKFAVNYSEQGEQDFLNSMKRKALVISLILGGLIAAFSPQLQQIFNTNSKSMFILFALGIPVYFLMSINRGFYQGHKDFIKLSISYQSEMLSRLLLTLLFLLLLSTNTSALVAVGILFSLFFGLIPFKKTGLTFRSKLKLDVAERKQINRFILITAFYEMTQIIINNSDILLVKHYFDAYEAGLFASLALIGRVVYFIAWMFVMILLPTVVEKSKNGENTLPVFFKYLSYVVLLATVIVLSTMTFPELIVSLMFGSAYLEIAPILWQYAIATAIFAISNVFVYYFLSLEKYWPVVISGVFGMAQIGLIVFFHNSLAQVVHVQILAMVALLLIQVAFFIYQHKINIHRR